MKHSFISAMLKGGEPAVTTGKSKTVTADNQCSDCGGSSNVVAKSGMEDTDISKMEGAKAETALAANTEGGTTTIIGKGPLGEIFTQALNKQYRRVNTHAEFKTGLEGIDTSRVSANGQILPETQSESVQAARTRIITGVLPRVDANAPATCLNAAIQAMDQVRNVEFIFVSDPSLGKNPTQQEMEPVEVKAIPFDSGEPSSVTAAVESVQIIIKLKKA